MSPRPSYDEIRLDATPCLGGCGLLLTHGRALCPACQSLVDLSTWTFSHLLRVSRIWAQPDREECE